MMHGRVAVVTGAGNGIGRAVARRLSERGCIVAALDRDPTAFETKLHPELRFYEVDATKSADVNAVMKRVLSDNGRIDILVNGVGAAQHEHAVDAITDDEWERTFDLNVRSAFFCTRAAVPAMKSRSWGRIVNVSAVAGRTYTFFGGADFTAAKAAIIGFTRQCALELAPHGINVNAVAPGLTLSERVAASWEAKSEAERAPILSRIPAGRPSTVDEQASAICYLCSDEASYVSGAVLDVCGAMYVP